MILQGFPGSSDGKESTCNARDLGSIPGLGRFPGEGKGTPLQCSCLENPVEEETGWLQGEVSKTWTQLRDFHFTSWLVQGVGQVEAHTQVGSDGSFLKDKGVNEPCGGEDRRGGR